jgi:dual specificity tyrosine-phosphorylation-regulated kinase 2/3/4
MRQPNSRSLAGALNTDNVLFVDFIHGCLKLDPSERMTPAQAVKHSWIVEALKQKDQQSVPPPLITKRSVSISDKEASDMPNQGAAITLPPLKHVPRVKERASSQRLSNAKATSRGRVQEVTGMEEGGKSPCTVSGEGTKPGSFLPKIN